MNQFKQNHFFIQICLILIMLQNIVFVKALNVFNSRYPYFGKRRSNLVNIFFFIFFTKIFFYFIIKNFLFLNFFYLVSIKNDCQCFMVIKCKTILKLILITSKQLIQILFDFYETFKQFKTKIFLRVCFLECPFWFTFFIALKIVDFGNLTCFYYFSNRYFDVIFNLTFTIKLSNLGF